MTTLAAVWAAVAPAISTQATFPPPPLDARVWEEVAAGKVARRTFPGTAGGDAPATVVGVGVLDVTREEAWLSLTDDRLSAEIESLTEVALQGAWAAPKRLYQRLDLPWPLNDRHWVIALTNNSRLAASGVWERAWTLRPDLLADARSRTDGERFDAAETVTVNEGGWLLVPLDTGDTLAVYQARATLGGAIPDGAVDSYTRSSMTSLFEGVERNAANVRKRYGAGCTPQPGADGQPIPCLR